MKRLLLALAITAGLLGTIAPAQAAAPNTDFISCSGLAYAPTAQYIDGWRITGKGTMDVCNAMPDTLHFKVYLRQYNHATGEWFPVGPAKTYDKPTMGPLVEFPWYRCPYPGTQRTNYFDLYVSLSISKVGYTPLWPQPVTHASRTLKASCGLTST